MSLGPQSVHVSDSVQKSLDNIFGYIPNLIGFLAILLVGYVLARMVRAAVSKALGKVRMDQRLAATPAGKLVDNVSPGGKPSRLVGGVAFWLVFLYALSAAIGALRIPAVTSFMNQVLAYLPNVIAAVVIFVVAAAIAAGTVAIVQRTMGDTPTGKIAETTVPGLVMAIAVFMILTQLKIATAIVTITYAALLGMLALAGALAFGLGGRDVAAQLLDTAYQNGRKAQRQVRRDLRHGKESAEDMIDLTTKSRPRARARAQSG